MFWIVALAAFAIAATVVRHAVQDHRDAELQRQDALADIDRGATRSAPVAEPGPVATADLELPRAVQRDGQRNRTAGLSLPPDAHDPTAPQGDRARTR